MPLEVNPPPQGMTAPTPALVKPVDLQPALDRLHNAFREGFINAQDIQKRTEVGNTDAEAQRKQNEAAGAKAEQDRKDQEGGKGYVKQGRFARLLGLPPKQAAAPGAAVAPAPAVVPPALTPPSPGPAPMIESPGAAPGPFMSAASADDFNPQHESTDDLLSLVQEGGYLF